MTTALGWAALVLFMALFPTGRFVPCRMRWVVARIITEALLLIFLPAASSLNANSWPLAILSAIAVGTFLTAICSQIYRYRRRVTPVQRQQIKWMVFGIILTLLLWIGVLVFELLVMLTLPQAVAHVAHVRQPVSGVAASGHVRSDTPAARVCSFQHGTFTPIQEHVFPTVRR